ncbi:MAG: class I SAM-dependent methyltransferase [Acidimicrobiales bacterium]
MDDQFSTYYGLLRRLHQHLRPSRYLEIGVHKGHSLAFVQAGTEVVGVDPEPILEQEPPPNTTIVAGTSDEFFTRGEFEPLRRTPFDLVFVDGLHLYEQALADVLRAEQVCHPGSVILVHDCLPPDAVTAARERTTVLWSGDVWKAMLALRRHRADLGLHVVEAEPTGMGVITRLDPSGNGLPQWYDSAVAELEPMTFDDLVKAGRDESLGVVAGRWSAVEPLLP